MVGETVPTGWLARCILLDVKGKLRPHDSQKPIRFMEEDQRSKGSSGARWSCQENARRSDDNARLKVVAGTGAGSGTGAGAGVRGDGEGEGVVGEERIEGAMVEEEGERPLWYPACALCGLRCPKDSSSDMLCKRYLGVLGLHQLQLAPTS